MPLTFYYYGDIQHTPITVFTTLFNHMAYWNLARENMKIQV